MAQQNTTPKWLEDRDNSGVVLSSVDIKINSLPLKSELDSVLDSDPSTAPCADCFMLDAIKDSGPHRQLIWLIHLYVEDFESL